MSAGGEVALLCWVAFGDCCCDKGRVNLPLQGETEAGPKASAKASE